MIPRDAQPLEHRSPYRRIDLYGPQPAATVDARSPGLEALAASARKIEGERIWKLIRQSAEGCNAPTPANPGESHRVVEIDTDGWDAA